MGPAARLVSPLWMDWASAVPSVCDPSWSDFEVDEHRAAQDHLPPEQLGESPERVEAQATQGQADTSDSGKPSHRLLSEMGKCSVGAGDLVAAIKGPRGTGRIEEGGHHSLATPIHPRMWAQPLPSTAPGQGLLPVCAGDAPVLRPGAGAPWHGPGPGLSSWAVPRCWCQSSCRSSATSLVCMGVRACGR